MGGNRSTRRVHDQDQAGADRQIFNDFLIGVWPFGRQDLHNELGCDIEKTSRLRAPIVLGVRDEDDVGAANLIGI
jgi:hypothetical protein